MDEKIKIAYLTKSLHASGITNVIMNYSTHLNKEKFAITIISGTPVLDIYRKQCEEQGIKIIELPDKIKSSKQYYLAMWRSLSKKKYDIVHIHGNSATITIELVMAMLKGIKVRIAHSHNSTCDNKRIHKLLSPIFKVVYTKGFACSELAGHWLFGDKSFTVLPNGFVTCKFIFDEKKRHEIRRELGIENRFVIGTVARFNEQKNHTYLLKMFESVAADREDACLLLVGDGPDLEKIQAQIEKHPYKDRIIYYGITDRVEYIYDAIDVFVLPSKYEGLGIVFLEAQISGVECITSDAVPREVDFGGRVTFLPLDDDTSRWKKAILDAKEIDRAGFYEKYIDKIETYDIKNNAQYLEMCYEQLLGR